MNIVVIFGGDSPEHLVSIRSAANVIRELNISGKYSILPIYINRNGKWYFDNNLDGIISSGEAMAEIDVSSLNEAFLRENQSSTLEVDSQPIKLDKVIPLVHGNFGEDGKLQAILDRAGTKYTGPGKEASERCFDKVVTKVACEEAGIKVVPSIVLDDTKDISYEEASETLGSEVIFVKPARGGSSIGVSRAFDEDSLNKALEKAAAIDNKILVEKAIIGAEVECAVKGKPGELQASIVGQIRPPQNTFYSYEEKYNNGSHSELLIPAEISNKATKKVRETAVKVCEVMGCSSMSRVDFFVEEKTGDIYLNEINTIPGFTSISMYPSLWVASGITYGELLEQLINDL